MPAFSASIFFPKNIALIYNRLKLPSQQNKAAGRLTPSSFVLQYKSQLPGGKNVFSSPHQKMYQKLWRS
jgi:hypothetical protein